MVRLLSIYIHIFVGSIALLDYLKPVAGEECVPLGACSCKFANGSITSLWAIDDHNSARWQNLVEPDTNWLFMYNPCTPFLAGTSDNSDCHETLFCQKSASGDTFYDVGNPLKFGTSVDNNQLYFTYTGGVRGLAPPQIRKTRMLLICDKKMTEPKVSVLPEHDLIYSFTLTSICACPDGCPYLPDTENKRHLSVGSILLILALVLLVVYFIAGILYNKYRAQKSGLELIPNKAFWSSLPGYIKDGCLFSKSKILRRSAEYQEIK